MNRTDHNSKLRIFVVGDSIKEIISDVINSLGTDKFDIEVCDDIYTLFSRIAKREMKNLMVIGCLRQLAKEQGRFFEIARNNDLACCCVIDNGNGHRAEEILAAVKAGAFIISEPVEIKEVIKSLYSYKGSCYLEDSELRPVIKDEFRTTKAELDALLGNVDA